MLAKSPFTDLPSTGADFDPVMARLETEVTAQRPMLSGRTTTRLRAYLGLTYDVPRERQIYLAAQNPTETFGNHFLRPRGAPLASSVGDFESRPRERFGDHYAHLGGAGLRGYDAWLPAPGVDNEDSGILQLMQRVAAANAEQAVTLWRFGPESRPLHLTAAAFADVAYALVDPQGENVVSLGTRLMADAGVGLALRGHLFDRDVRARVDFPVWVRQPQYAVGARVSGGDQFGPGAVPSRTRFRWVVSFADLW
jgi:hypothetical protein